MRTMGAHKKQHIMLQENKKRFERLGNTFHSKMGGRSVIATCEPENIKTVLSLKFKDYSLGITTLMASAGQIAVISCDPILLETRLLISKPSSATSNSCSNTFLRMARLLTCRSCSSC